MMQFELRPALWQQELNEFFGNRDQVLPACEILDTENAYVVALDIPGFKKEDIELELKDRHLHISGTRSSRERSQKDKVLKQERRFGKFHRAFALPEGIDEQNVSAKFTDGVLEVTLPKVEVTSKKIVVN